MAGLNKKAMMMVGLVLFLMACTTRVEARFDADIFLAQVMNERGEPNYFLKSTTTACCNNCVCTTSIPPQCHCKDVGETCHSTCKACLCTSSYPPKCWCVDTTNFCYDKCSSSA
ncbi:Bowman-Birk type wound-induced trypsin inhibitor-like [Prosopis cineraria]|uniref:Bowman-Birk type wound-induced trypsin inhibitor-like n=1 Tax=Prosopis cineraria TaxID=364024 RepID=UPI00241067BF|nr:Bowman-Birk type wound-induced trypsin inhibitor-like [Prosopis cineraria]